MRTRSRATLRPALAAAAVAVLTLAGLGAGIAPQAARANPGVTVQRVSGSDRYATAVALAQRGYPTTAPVVVLATGTNYPDALAAGPVAAQLGGPLLLTAPGFVPSAVLTEIQALDPRTVVVVGGVSAISGDVLSTIQSALPHATVTRVAGADRYATSAAVVRYGFGAGAHVPGVYLATGRNFPDALSAAAAAGAAHEPVLLLNGVEGALDSVTSGLISDLSPAKATIVGGYSAVSPDVETGLDGELGLANVSRLAGSDRFQTSHLIAAAAFTSAHSAFFATGTNFPDALAGSALAAAQGAPLFTVPAGCVSAQVLADITALGVTSVTVIGGTSVIGSGVEGLVPCPGSIVESSSHPVQQPVASAIPADATSGEAPTLTSISCVAIGQCAAAGGYRSDSATPASAEAPVVEFLDNGSTSADTRNAPLSGHNTWFTSISCFDTLQSCIAAGSAGNSAPTYSMIRVLSPSGWSAAAFNWATVDPVTTSCGRIDSCASVGQDYGRGIAWTGHTSVSGNEYDFQYVHLRPPWYLSSSLPTQQGPIGCGPDGLCLVAGTYSTSNSPELAWFGPGIDSVIAAPEPADANPSARFALDAAACGGNGHCVASGSYPDRAGVQHGLIEILADGVWTAERAPLADPSMAGTNVELNSATCTPSACTIVGEYEAGTSHAEGLVETVTGSVVTPQEVALPPGGRLDGVACSPAQSCALWGTSTTGTRGIVGTESDGSWSMRGVLAPSGAQIAGIAAGSCPDVGWCGFVEGYGSDTDWQQELMTLHW